MFVQEIGYTKHMAGHASSMTLSGRMQSVDMQGCAAAADRYHHIFSDVDTLYTGRRRHAVVDSDMKKTSRLFRPAAMSGDDRRRYVHK